MKHHHLITPSAKPQAASPLQRSEVPYNSSTLCKTPGLEAETAELACVTLISAVTPHVLPCSGLSCHPTWSSWSACSSHPEFVVLLQCTPHRYKHTRVFEEQQLLLIRREREAFAESEDVGLHPATSWTSCYFFPRAPEAASSKLQEQDWDRTCCLGTTLPCTFHQISRVLLHRNAYIPHLNRSHKPWHASNLPMKLGVMLFCLFKILRG
ncbi:uncharacterized protein LOC127383331 [Apus apus]|uniref:uncharacterized protein LOC127383331 n=1 Tax=Apus apus TaxID=8895 RepID=UPI0021F90907|nr:uncharacterized protein LOC127383331 [Apus apus]